MVAFLFWKNCAFAESKPLLFPAACCIGTNWKILFINSKREYYAGVIVVKVYHNLFIDLFSIFERKCSRCYRNAKNSDANGCDNFSTFFLEVAVAPKKQTGTVKSELVLCKANIKQMYLTTIFAYTLFELYFTHLKL